MHQHYRLGVGRRIRQHAVGAPRQAAGVPPAVKDASVAAAAQQRGDTQAPQGNQQPPPVYIQDSATNAFLDWAKSAGIAFDRLRPAQFGGLRGLVAAAPIKTDDIILSVPRQVSLTLPPKLRCPCPDYIQPEFWDSAPWYVKLGASLLNEKRKGPASKMAQYLQQLPKNVDTPVTWSDERLQQLQYPYLILNVGGTLPPSFGPGGFKTPLGVLGFGGVGGVGWELGEGSDCENPRAVDRCM